MSIMVQWLKGQPFNGKLWQRNYYEHIIRNEQSYQRIADYIINNPENWKKDNFFNKKDKFPDVVKMVQIKRLT